MERDGPMTDDLYTHKISADTWLTACGTENPGDSDPNGESCVVYAPLPGGGMALRDNKNDGAGELRFTGKEWTRFMDEYTRAA